MVMYTGSPPTSTSILGSREEWNGRTTKRAYKERVGEDGVVDGNRGDLDPTCVVVTPQGKSCSGPLFGYVRDLRPSPGGARVTKSWGYGSYTGSSRSYQRILT